MKDLGWANALIVCAVFIVAGVLAIVPAFTRPKRNKRTGLPPPDSRTQRAPDWRRYELQTPRRYIP